MTATYDALRGYAAPVPKYAWNEDGSPELQLAYERRVAVDDGVGTETANQQPMSPILIVIVNTPPNHDSPGWCTRVSKQRTMLSP